VGEWIENYDWPIWTWGILFPGNRILSIEGLNVPRSRPVWASILKQEEKMSGPQECLKCGRKSRWCLCRDHYDSAKKMGALEVKKERLARWAAVKNLLPVEAFSRKSDDFMMGFFQGICVYLNKADTDAPVYVDVNHMKKVEWFEGQVAKESIFLNMWPATLKSTPDIQLAFVLVRTDDYDDIPVELCMEIPRTPFALVVCSEKDAKEVSWEDYQEELKREQERRENRNGEDGFDRGGFNDRPRKGSHGGNRRRGNIDSSFMGGRPY